MSTAWISEILNARRRLDLNGQDLFAALMIASYANKDTGQCNPSLATLARDLDCSERTVQRIVVRLGSVFDIADGRGRGRSSNFRLRLKPDTGDAFSRVKPDTGDAFSEKTRQTRRENTTNATGKHDKRDIAYKEEPGIEPGIEPERSKKAERGSRIPEPFIVTAEMRGWAVERRPDIDIDLETEKFCYYWQSKPGAGGRKINWAATWRNWILNAKQSYGQRKQNAAEQRRDEYARTIDAGNNLDDATLNRIRQSLSASAATDEAPRQLTTGLG